MSAPDRHQMMHDLDQECAAMMEHLCECVSPAIKLGMDKELKSLKRALDRFHKHLSDLHREATASAHH